MATATQLFTYPNIEVVEVLGPVATSVKATAADIIAKGDILEVSSTTGLAQVQETVATDKFLGVSLTDSPASDVSPSPSIAVSLKTVVRVKLSGTVYVGSALCKAAGPTKANLLLGTRADYTFSVNAVDAYGWALQAGVSGDTIKAYFDAIAVASQVTGTAWVLITS